jgi:heat shock protein HtpX
LGVQPYLSNAGIDFGALLAFCAVAGFAGSLISLALSRVMAKWMMGVQVIDPAQPASPAERELVHMVHRLSQKVGLPAMPEVGIYDSPEVNAFATGPTKARALVAVSTGLLNRMDSTAVEGVLAHEVSHIANGDMVTMTLLQGVVNTFVMFFARVAAWGVSQAFRSRDNEEGSPMIHFVAVMVFEILFSLLGAVVVAFFSRWREYRADRGGADLAGRDRMIHALSSLKNTFEPAEMPSNQTAVAALKINGKSSGLLALLASHPDLDSRIAALRAAH